METITLITEEITKRLEKIRGEINRNKEINEKIFEEYKWIEQISKEFITQHPLSTKAIRLHSLLKKKEIYFFDEGIDGENPIIEECNRNEFFYNLLDYKKIKSSLREIEESLRRLKEEKRGSKELPKEEEVLEKINELKNEFKELRKKSNCFFRNLKITVAEMKGILAEFSFKKVNHLFD